jgi:FkbM family methyltransferase
MISMDYLAVGLAHCARVLPRGYGRVLPWLASRSNVLKSLTVLIPDCGDMVLDLRESVCIPLFKYRCYPHQTAEDDFVRMSVRPGALVFDIGANIGFYTKMLSNLVGPAGRVVAVEPMPRALALLRKNVNLALPNISVIPSAIGPLGCRAEIQETRALDRSTVVFGDSGATEVVTLDTLMDRFSMPDFVKIDVEGAELGAMRGATRMMSAEIRPIVLFEYIKENAEAFGGYSLRNLLACFGSGYHFFRVAAPLQLVNIDGGNPGTNVTNDYVAIPDREVDRFQSVSQ